MNRRRLLWLCVPLVVIGVLAAWFALAQRDADIHVIGPKTRGVRATLAMLDSKINAGDFHDCKTIDEALIRVGQKLHPNETDLARFDWGLRFTRVDQDAFTQEKMAANLAQVPIQISRESQPMAAKELLRMVFRQTEAHDVHFLIRGQTLDVTTLKCVQEERARYFASVTLADRMRNWWKELTGEIEEDPMIFLVD